MSEESQPPPQVVHPRLRDVPVTDRLQLLSRMTTLTDADIAALRMGLSLDQADRMIENVVATYALPFGIAENFVVNGREVLVPMVVEESSVVAACSFAAKMARAGGGFTAGSTDPIMIGQLQVLECPDSEAAVERLHAAADELILWLNTQNTSTISRHSRAVGLEIRQFEVEGVGAPATSFKAEARNAMLVVHVLYDCGDAMGANLINTACEALAPRIEAIMGGRVNLRILSNLSDRRRAWASCRIPAHLLGAGRDEQLQVAQHIVEASLFAEADPYRAATHNKGVMNGVDAVVIATGNDWRAVEAGAHAYAARNGRYSSLTRWRIDEQGDLVGEIDLPLAVGIVGGATRVHPSAQVALKILAVRTARELAEIIVCVGLAQNFAALRALVSEGIQHGHMALHARQVAAAAGAVGEQVDRVAAQMVSEGNIRPDRARQIIANMARQSST
ncbi:MAG: hydroxymethylglutaryl-CoA reductase, degradative [Chloroflexi bacterium]|nr:hydroxymethylglutaryl-CoA reductase, degradative [Chloroflexota bacterium]